MKIHSIKTLATSGTDYGEVYPPARKLFTRIKARTKRQPYVRSAYFA